MASQTLILQNPNRLSSYPTPNPPFLPSLPKPASVTLSLRAPKTLKLRVLASSSTNPPLNFISRPAPRETLLTGSTRTITTFFAIAFAASKLVAKSIFNVGLQLKAVNGVQQPFIYTTGPLFFAARGGVSTPMTVVAAGMAKWLDIYSGVLMVRVLLSWFPNIPWDRQPLSAIRDLCDPFLNLFRGVIPPLFRVLDITPLLAFAILGVLGSILKSYI